MTDNLGKYNFRPKIEISGTSFETTNQLFHELWGEIDIGLFSTKPE